MKTCPKCQKLHDKKGTFCSRSCANSRERTEEIRRSVSEKLKGRSGKPSVSKGKYLVDRIDRHCLTCEKEFLTTAKADKKYCSLECWKIKSGGYREGSGRAKTGYYKGIYCGSTYELCWVIYNIDHNIKFTRFDKLLSNNDLKYYPDFLLSDGKTIVEIKGYENQESVDRKSKLAESFGYNVIVLREKDLGYAFDYVSKIYSDKYITLYDNYKPRYTYNCNNCNTKFFKDYKKRTDIVFCSRKCSGNHVAIR